MSDASVQPPPMRDNAYVIACFDDPARPRFVGRDPRRCHRLMVTLEPLQGAFKNHTAAELALDEWTCKAASGPSIDGEWVIYEVAAKYDFTSLQTAQLQTWG